MTEPWAAGDLLSPRREARVLQAAPPGHSQSRGRRIRPRGDCCVCGHFKSRTQASNHLSLDTEADSPDGGIGLRSFPVGLLSPRRTSGQLRTTRVSGFSRALGG